MARTQGPIAISLMPSKSLITRHAILCLAFVASYLLLSQPAVILINRLGFVAWYPATGLVLAWLLGISPWYAFLAFICDNVAGALFYHQPLRSFTESIGAVTTASTYALAAYTLRGPLRIDLNLRQQRDVLRYLLVTMTAAVLATSGGVMSLLLSHAI